MGISTLSPHEEVVVEGNSQCLKVHQGQEIVARDILSQNRPLHGDIGRAPGDINASIVGSLDGDVVNDDVVGGITDGDAIASAYCGVSDPQALHDHVMRAVLPCQPDAAVNQGNPRRWGRETVDSDEGTFHFNLLIGNVNGATHIEHDGTVAL